MTAQLIDTRSDATLWSGKYKGTLDDVFAIQEEVSRAIVDSLPGFGAHGPHEGEMGRIRGGTRAYLLSLLNFASSLLRSVALG